VRGTRAATVGRMQCIGGWKIHRRRQTCACVYSMVWCTGRERGEKVAAAAGPRDAHTVEGGDSNTPLWSSVSLCIHFPEISHTVLSVINSFHVQVEPVPFALVAVPVTHVCQ